MKNLCRLVLVSVFVCGGSSVYADILEVKNKGFINGEILSEDDREVRFKNADGSAQTFARADILFIEKEAKVKKPLFTLPKYQPSEKPKPPAPKTTHAPAATSLTGDLAGRVQEMNAKIALETAYMNQEHQMAQAQRAIYNQANPGTFPDADDSWLPQNRSSDSDSSSKGTFTSL